MIKHLKKTIVLACAVLAPQCVKADWYEWQRDPADQQTMKSAVLLAEQQFENDLKPHSQDPDIKDAILRWKTPQAELIRQYIGFQFLSKYQAKKLAETIASDFAKDKTVELMMHKAVKEITKSETANDIVISDQGKEIIISKIKKEVIDSLKRGYRPSSVLQDFTKQDYYKITKMERLVAQEIAKLSQQYITSNFKEKYFSENDITELYPEGKVDAMRRKIEQGKVLREPACSICLEDFSKLGKRVNLDCGVWAHGNMCMGCAAKNIHIENDNQCPVCRNSFSRLDFSLKYLKENMNAYDLGILKKLDLETFNKISVLFSKVR